jgi:hypothetical protein
MEAMSAMKTVDRVIQEYQARQFERLMAGEFVVESLRSRST